MINFTKIAYITFVVTLILLICSVVVGGFIQLFQIIFIDNNWFINLFLTLFLLSSIYIIIEDKIKNKKKSKR